jgi:hypothetical protein|tara:strand:- start:2580 stop:2894 length:315 start_codon:yes stop_codon:yes gene_type:complete
MTTESEKTYVALAAEGKLTFDMIGKFIGKEVCVSWIKNKDQLRQNFLPQISVQGKLEGFNKIGKFRVLLTDNTYSYFTAEDVWMLSYDGEKLVTDKQRPVIFID